MDQDIDPAQSQGGKTNLREGWFVAPDLNVEGQGRPTRLLTVGDLFPRVPFFSVFQMLSMWWGNSHEISLALAKKKKNERELY